MASSHSVPVLIGWRLIQAFGASSGMSVGAAVVGDIYKLEERGTAMGIFFGVRDLASIAYIYSNGVIQASLVGPAVAPVFGGTATHYASWRVMQLVIAAASALVGVLMLLYFPETCHPGTRGIDKLRAKKGQDARFAWVNPFASLLLLRSPNLLLVVCRSNLSKLSVPINNLLGTGRHDRSYVRLW